MHNSLYDCLNAYNLDEGVCNVLLSCEMFHPKRNMYVEKSKQIQDGHQKSIKLCITLHDCVQACLNAYILDLDVCNAWLSWMWGVPPEREYVHYIIKTNPRWPPKINKIMYHFTWLHIRLFECLYSWFWGLQCLTLMNVRCSTRERMSTLTLSKQIQDGRQKSIRMMYHFTWWCIKLFEVPI